MSSLSHTSCLTDGCYGQHRAQGYCAVCYNRLKRHGQLRNLNRTTEERFWEKVIIRPNECWGWKGFRNAAGYGCFHLQGGPHIDAHRFLYQLLNGPIPDGLFVLHKCDNPQCTNPEHLFLGTHLENVKDMWSKGRAWPQKYHSKVTDQAAAEIRALLAKGELSQREIGERFGVSETTVRRIKKNEWGQYPMRERSAHPRKQ